MTTLHWNGEVYVSEEDWEYELNETIDTFEYLDDPREFNTKWLPTHRVCMKQAARDLGWSDTFVYDQFGHDPLDIVEGINNALNDKHGISLDRCENLLHALDMFPYETIDVVNDQDFLPNYAKPKEDDDYI